MKCARCASEVPGQAQFCMKCGAPVVAGRPGGTVTMARPIAASAPDSSGRNKKIAAITALALLLAIAAFFGIKNFLNRGARVEGGAKLVDASGRAGTGPLLDTGARVAGGSPLTNDAGKVGPGTPDPVDVIDYLKHVKETERNRVRIAKSQLAEALNWSSQLTAQNLTAEMSENPEEGHKRTYNNFQQSMNKWNSQWEELSRAFLAYPKPVPQSCTGLRNYYLDALGKTSASMTAISSGFADAMSGNAAGALDRITSLQGSASRSVDEACDKADSELAAVCDKFRIQKDFDIKADGGASNPFGVGR
jgi:hypothetical protein